MKSVTIFSRLFSKLSIRSEQLASHIRLYNKDKMEGSRVDETEWKSSKSNLERERRLWIGMHPCIRHQPLHQLHSVVGFTAILLH